jgi:membrane protease YdiL (CAAX protease family)
MNLERIRQSQSKVFIFALIATTYFVQFYGLWALPFMEVNFPRPWDVYFVRAVNTTITLLIVWAVAPLALRRFTFKFRPKTFWIGVIFSIAATIPNIYYFGVKFDGYWDLFGGFIFAMAIGVDEEIYDRIFTFGVLERFGMEFALIVSASLFGLAHFTNYLYGDESFNYVLGHMVDAATFGYLMAALMLMTGNIWLPILVHGLIDLPWVMMPKQEFTEAVTGGTDWLNVAGYAITNILIARVMIFYMKGNFNQLNMPPHLERAARYLGLIK